MDKAATKVIRASQIIFNARVERTWSLSRTLLFFSCQYIVPLPLPRACTILFSVLEYVTLSSGVTLHYWSEPERAPCSM